MVATHSRKVPSPSSTSDPIDVAHFNSIDNMVPQTFDDYELWGEEHTVEIHEVQLKFDGVIMSANMSRNYFVSDHISRHPLSHFRNGGHWKCLLG
jgi:hypothetical protein